MSKKKREPKVVDVIPVLTEEEAMASTQAVPVAVPVRDEPRQQWFTMTLDAQWTERLERLAQPTGMTPQAFMQTLLRRAWASLPRSLRRDEDPSHEGQR